MRYTLSFNGSYIYDFQDKGTFAQEMCLRKDRVCARLFDSGIYVDVVAARERWRAYCVLQVLGTYSLLCTTDVVNRNSKSVRHVNNMFATRSKNIMTGSCAMF